MTPNEPIPKKPLRLWPGVAAAVLLGVVRFIVPVVLPDAAFFAVLGGLVGAMIVVLWWVFFSRAAWSERLGSIGLMIAGLFATSRLVDVSIANGSAHFHWTTVRNLILVLSVSFGKK